MLHVFPMVCVCLQYRGNIQSKLGVICTGLQATLRSEKLQNLTLWFAYEVTLEYSNRDENIVSA